MNNEGIFVPPSRLNQKPKPPNFPSLKRDTLSLDQVETIPERDNNFARRQTVLEQDKQFEKEANNFGPRQQFWNDTNNSRTRRFRTRQTSETIPQVSGRVKKYQNEINSSRLTRFQN